MHGGACCERSSLREILQSARSQQHQHALRSSYHTLVLTDLAQGSAQWSLRSHCACITLLRGNAIPVATSTNVRERGHGDGQPKLRKSFTFNFGVNCSWPAEAPRSVAVNGEQRACIEILKMSPIRQGFHPTAPPRCANGRKALLSAGRLLSTLRAKYKRKAARSLSPTHFNLQSPDFTLVFVHSKRSNPWCKHTRCGRKYKRTPPCSGTPSTPVAVVEHARSAAHCVARAPTRMYPRRFEPMHYRPASVEARARRVSR